ncbi:MAG TPA: xanthine dehydrogenase family protein subunit M [Actinospica sp.]|jgi:xanthine dehydrogenase YagS FAD-binding subunit|nr:xanthine dehydrogenase family protein subunit M [Actinospica sp.]
MRPFRYERAADEAEAVQLCAEGGSGATYLGGGTNLVDLMKLGVARPETVIDVSHLPSGGVRETSDGALLVGAGVSNSELAADTRVRRSYPVLSQALLSGASGQLRNVATVGGNLLQRTRCPYFMDPTKPCNKRSPGTGCPARDGEHHNLAVLGASEACIATHPSDMAVAMVALDSRVHVRSRETERSVPVEELYRLPGEEPDRDFTLAPGELVTAVEVPSLPWATRSAYRKARERTSYAFANGSVAAALDIEDGTVRDVRLAFGAVAARPWRARAAEEVLRGGQASRARFAAAAEAELEACEPLRDNAYKLPLIRNLVTSVLNGLVGGAS